MVLSSVVPDIPRPALTNDYETSGLTGSSKWIRAFLIVEVIAAGGPLGSNPGVRS